MDEFTVDEDVGSTLHDLVGRSELQLRPVPVDSPGEAEEEQLRGSPITVAEEQDAGDEDGKKEPTNPGQTFRSSARVGKTPRRLAHLAMAATNKPSDDGRNHGKFTYGVVPEGDKGRTEVHRGQWRLGENYSAAGKDCSTV